MALKAKAVQAEAKEAEASAETAESAEGGAQAKNRKFSLKLIAMAAAGAVLVLGGGTAAYLMLGGYGNAHPAAAEAKPAVFLDVPEVLVNLSNAGSDHTQYLKIKLVLELADPALMQQIQPVMPRIMDAFQTYLRELRPTDLDGSAGLYRLKEELTRRVNTAIAPRKVNGVLFKEIVVQ